MLSDRFLVSLAKLNGELHSVERGDVYTIFGSAAMALRELLPRDPGDIDIMVTRVTWAGLMTRGWEVETPAAGDPPLLTLHTPIPVHAFFDWNDEHVHMDVEKVLREAERVEINGGYFRCAPLTTLLRHKEEALKYGDEHPKFGKHAQDIAILKREIAAERGVSRVRRP